MSAPSRLEEWLDSQRAKISLYWGGDEGPLDVSHANLVEYWGYEGHKVRGPEDPAFLPVRGYVERLNDLSFLKLNNWCGSFFHHATGQLEWAIKNPPWVLWAMRPQALLPCEPPLFGGALQAALDKIEELTGVNPMERKAEEHPVALRAHAFRGALQFLETWWFKLYQVEELTDKRDRWRQVLLDLVEKAKTDDPNYEKVPEMVLNDRPVLADIMAGLEVDLCGDSIERLRKPDGKVKRKEIYLWHLLKEAGAVGSRSYRCLGWKLNLEDRLNLGFIGMHSKSTVQLLEEGVADLQKTLGAGEPEGACVGIRGVLKFLNEHAEAAVMQKAEDLLPEQAKVLQACEEIIPHMCGDILLQGGYLQRIEKKRLAEAGWSDDFHSLHVSECFGKLMVYHLPTLKKDRVEIKPEDICDDEGTLLPRDEAAKRLKNIYNDFEDEQEYRDFLKQLEDEEPFEYAAQAFVEFFSQEFGENEKFSEGEIEDCCYYEPYEGDDCSSIESSVSLRFQCGYTTWQVVVFPDLGDCHVEDLAASISVNRLVEGYDDCYGGCWLRYRGILGEREEARVQPFSSMSPKLQEDYIDWCREAVSMDGWSHGMCSYDGCGYTWQVEIEGRKLGFIYWRKSA